VPDYKEMQTKATEAVASAIAQHLHATAALMAEKAASNGGPSINDAEIMARLDLILAKLEQPVVPLLNQLWGTAQIGSYLRRSTDNVRKEIVCLPSFPARSGYLYMERPRRSTRRARSSGGQSHTKISSSSEPGCNALCANSNAPHTTAFRTARPAPALGAKPS
jgi:hypothetical protein